MFKHYFLQNFGGKSTKMVCVYVHAACVLEALGQFGACCLSFELDLIYLHVILVLKLFSDKMFSHSNSSSPSAKYCSVQVLDCFSKCCGEDT